ncbi:MAG TPA: HEPN domain-containing protein [Hadesarchaea archaeon]|nr:HEPN domain-containing protein [Hadesarchaea archaeon]
MKFEELEKEGLIKSLPVNRERVRDSFKLAERDLRTATKLLKDDHDWAFSIAYNSMLQAARALMFSCGYRPSGDAQHMSVIRFVEASMGKESNEIIIAFDRMRRKRHIAIYDRTGATSETDARNAIKWAEEFFNEVKKILTNGGFV